MGIEIKKVWFKNDHIFIQTASGEERSHPLIWFPRLLKRLARKGEATNYLLSEFIGKSLMKI